MVEPISKLPQKTIRLKFIDMARSVAILLMLEGHFVNETLMQEYQQPDHLAYWMWNFFRGVAAPLFFTVAGMVFVYLLTRDREPRLLDKPRVRKGLKRAAILLFWGYALQINLWRLPNYFRGELDSWLSAFHVLQCVAVGIIFLIAIFGVQRFAKRIPLSLCYVAGAGLILLLDGYLRMLPRNAYLPAGAPELIQNMLKGPHSQFAIAPWLVFTFVGGAIGALLRASQPKVSMPWFPLTFIALAIALKVMGGVIHILAPNLPTVQAALQGQVWIYGRAGDIFVLLGVLLVIEHRFAIRESWFLRVGRHTFPIYVLHVIVLYGGIFGLGLSTLIGQELTPFQAGIGSVIFMTFFVLLVPLFEWVAIAWEKLKPRFRRLEPPANGR